jgi:GNAT superfamily N-acetyltransferase
MAAGYALRDLDPVGDRSALEGLWRAALGPAWPLPGGLDLVRAGVVAERHAVLAGAVAIDPAGSIQLLLVDPAQQRRGVGTRLLDAALQRLGALGLARSTSAAAGRTISGQGCRTTCLARSASSPHGAGAGTMR